MRTHHGRKNSELLPFVHSLLGMSQYEILSSGEVSFEWWNMSMRGSLTFIYWYFASSLDDVLHDNLVG
jgi:hypothetical protein